MRGTRIAFLLALCSGVPANAAADWQVTPFIGFAFAGETSLVDLENAAGETKLTYGVTVGFLSDGIFGLEADLGVLPRFFQRDEGPRLILGSNVTTLTGNVIVAVPLRWTRESLRPYGVAGIGLMHAAFDDLVGVFRVERNLVAFGVGGGVLGFFNDRTGLRLEIRHFRDLGGSADDSRVGFGATDLSFWRASAGVILRYW